MTQACEVKVRFCPPPEPLRRYFTTFYLTEITVNGSDAPQDRLHPEWANLRFYNGQLPTVEPLGSTPRQVSSFAVTGPSSRALPFTGRTSRMWGVGLLPLGWARFIGAQASDYADGVFDGLAEGAFAPCAPLARTLFGPEPDPEAELARITDHFLARLDAPPPDEARITALHAAMVDPETRDVADLCARTGMGQRMLERLARRHFGFPPKLLLRRQRFLRSLAQFMLDPSRKWVGAMDGQYHDQAQFVRDFRQFMGITPRQYAALPKPVLGAIVHERARHGGHAVQALDGPEGAPVSR